MKKLLIASNNQGKILEIRKVFSDLDLQVITRSQTDLPEEFDPEETGETFQDNAKIKAQEYAQETGLAVLADDSGLIVDALDGRPGVYSKRYGDDDLHRNQKLLEEMKDVETEKRTARFVSSLCVIDPETEKIFTADGVVEGKIAFEMRGDQGFGYDPIFIPDEIEGDQTFAELGTDVKNTISHRARALQALKKKLKS